MDKKALWDKFIQTGKVSDYLNYSRAVKNGNIDEIDLETAEELYPGEDYKYDNQDGRYSNP
ncbi:MAG: hypothetical protein IJ349_08810 [Clostridia bacterium]|nr:hypothetical protein [Clostridia bacterium]